MWSATLWSSVSLWMVLFRFTWCYPVPYGFWKPYRVPKEMPQQLSSLSHVQGCLYQESGASPGFLILGSALSRPLTKRAKFFLRNIPNMISTSASQPILSQTQADCGSFRLRVCSWPPVDLSPLQKPASRQIAPSGADHCDGSRDLSSHLSCAATWLSSFIYWQLSISSKKDFRLLYTIRRMQK